ncbi:DUF2157 domain-containing protein [Roseibium sp. SCP14]|uniref:DUF2157 domain-containing protein n=1 Tax=Roseibium sp. SCP14 TaxID=3141375 RepID=UPI003338DBCF
MFDWAYKKRLKDDLETWVANGWITSAGASAILKEQDQEDGRSRLPTVLAGIGLVCVALAIFAFIAANWEAIPKALKLIGIAVLIAASHGVAAHAARKGRKGLADLLTGFATLVFVGGMALVGQIFHLPSDWAGGAFLVSLGGLAAAWLTGSKSSLVVAAAAAITWQVTRSDLGAGTVIEGTIGLAFLAAIFAHAIVYPSRLSRWIAISLLWVTYGRWFAETAEFLESTTGTGDKTLLSMALAGIGGLAALSVVIDPLGDLFVKWSSDRPNRKHGHWLMTRSMQDAGFLVLCFLLVVALVVVPEFSSGLSIHGLLTWTAVLPLGLALLLTGAGLLLSYKTTKSAALFAAIGFSLIVIVVPIFTMNILLLSAGTLTALIGLCALATWYNNRFWALCAYLGLTAIALWLLQVTIGSLLGQSVFFLVAGFLLLGVALWLARLFRTGKGGTENATITQEVQS